MGNDQGLVYKLLYKDKPDYYFVGYLINVQVKAAHKLWRAHKAPLITNNFAENRAEIAAAASQSISVVVSKGFGTGPITMMDRMNFPENCVHLCFSNHSGGVEAHRMV